jgi:hypothetical protein
MPAHLMLIVMTAGKKPKVKYGQGLGRGPGRFVKRQRHAGQHQDRQHRGLGVLQGNVKEQRAGALTDAALELINGARIAA